MAPPTTTAPGAATSTTAASSTKAPTSTSSTTKKGPAATKTTGLAALNVYKKVALVRRATDALTFQDEDGNLQTVTDLGATASLQQQQEQTTTASTSATASSAKLPKKQEIPTPRITEVIDYDKQVPPTYDVPTSYVRYNRMTALDLQQDVEYVADGEDEVWLINKFGSKRKQPNTNNNTNEQKQQPKKPKLTLDLLERMLDIMEKATGLETIITTDEAERSILGRIPELLYLFPTTKQHQQQRQLRTVIHDVYTYWVQKRSKLKRPLLRRYWPVTASDDTNPHLVFRPREKEKYKLRKKRQNDLEALKKMKQLRQDFDKVRVLLHAVERREQVQLLQLVASSEAFQQELHDLTDTSGLPRVSKRLHKETIQQLIGDVSAYEIGADGLQHKRRRTTTTTAATAAAAAASNKAGVATTLAGAAAASSSTSAPMDPTAAAAAAATSNRTRTIVAGQNHGEPAPLFLHPLASRERYISSWHNAVPFISTYQDSHSIPTHRFRHRPRVGRGGRICIDRLPYPASSATTTPVTVFTAGQRLSRTSTTTSATTSKDRLLDLLPQPPTNNEVLLSRRIQELCAVAIKEDYDAAFSNDATREEENDGEEVLVKVKDWLDTDDQLWGEERFAIGPI